MQTQVTLYMLVSMLFVASSTSAQGEDEACAWDLLTRDEVVELERTARLGREALRVLSGQQLSRYLAGASPEEITLENGQTLDQLLIAKGAIGLTIPWYTIDGGGTPASTGDGYVLGSTVGQPDAGSMTGGEFRLTGGFWPESADNVFCSFPDSILCDSFESGGFLKWGNSSGDERGWMSNGYL